MALFGMPPPPLEFARCHTGYEQTCCKSYIDAFLLIFTVDNQDRVKLETARL